MNLGDKIRAGTSWIFVGKVGHQVLHFAISVVLARLLLPEHFGLLITVQIFTGIAGFISGGGMGQALIQSKDMTPNDPHVVFTAQLVIGILIYTVFFLASPWFAVWFNEPIYEDLLRVSALTFLIRPFSNTSTSLLRRDMRFKAISFIQIAMLIVTGSSSIAMAVAGMEVWSLVLSGILGAFANMILAGHIARWHAHLAMDRAVLKRLGGYGLKVSAVNIVLYLKTQTGNFVISRFIGPAAVGIYNKATSLYQMPGRMITGSAHGVIFRALASVQENRDQSKYMYLRTLTLATVYALPFYIGLWWIAESFIYTVYGAKWTPSAGVLEILVPAGFFATVGSLSGAVGAARSLLGRELIVQLFTWALLAASILYAYRWGIHGVAWAAFCVAIVTSVLMTAIAVRELRVKLKELLAAFTPALMLNAILMAALAVTHHSISTHFDPRTSARYLLIMSAVGAAVYGGCFLYLPIAKLRKEAHRWKNRLRLSRLPLESLEP